MDVAGIESHIHQSMSRLTSAEKRAARALLANYPTIGLAPVVVFAREAGTSPATISRFVAQLGFKSYPDLQRALRDELEERVKSPLQRGLAKASSTSDAEHYLDGFFRQLGANMEASAARIPASEFESAAALLANLRTSLHITGGRFTEAMALYMEAHLRLVRPDVRRMDARAAVRADQMLDVRPGDVAILFDVRRYDPQLLETAAQLSARRAVMVLFTDEWISPASKYARIVIPCRIAMERTWDANAALFAVVEALIARVTELAWPTASKRLDAIDWRL
ncbi:MurR/RpiR family transcriptional regulator [Devosia sp.]|uniref:MurR/RpiR family transcriptional regulator n=1 Tax=Devosia sp. TaxID=1871048 RepID=UPI0032655A69